MSSLDLINHYREFSFNNFYYMLVIITFVILAVFFNYLIIKKSEINQFNQIKKIYHKKIIARLTKQYKDMYFLNLIN